MDNRIVRWAGVISAAAVALYVGFGLLTGPMSMALIVMLALMACGTLLAKHAIGPGALVALGALGAADAGMRLAFGMWLSPAWNLAYLAATVVALVSGVMLLRAARA
ncbi:hypothetical protein [Phenylobacterium sp.]|uniref:hypothetical protein n=1 Tax=Phenylobacterium sp. TaxID=1871053 RepID=UPI0035B1FE1C